MGIFKYQVGAFSFAKIHIPRDLKNNSRKKQKAQVYLRIIQDILSSVSRVSNDEY